MKINPGHITESLQKKSGSKESAPPPTGEAMSSDVCAPRFLNLPRRPNPNPNCTPPPPHRPLCGSPAAETYYLGLFAAPVAPDLPPLVQLPDGGGDQIPAIPEEAHKLGARSSILGTRTPPEADPYHSSSGSDGGEASRVAAQHIRHPPLTRNLEGPGDDDDDSLFDPDSMGTAADATVGRSGELAGFLNKKVNSLRGISLDIHSSDESTIHPANAVLIQTLKSCTGDTDMVRTHATGDYIIDHYFYLFDCWVSKLEEDAERICQGENGRRYIFLLNNAYDVWQMVRRPGASFPNVELVISRLISMIQRYKKSYLDEYWVPLNKQRRLDKFTAEFLVISSCQMTWKVTAELKYKLRQEIVDLIVPSYEASLLSLQANQGRLSEVFYVLKRSMTGKKKQNKYTAEELENMIRELFEG